MLLAVLDSPTTSVNVFLTRPYDDVVSDEDLQVINSKRVTLYVIYKGTCPKSNSYIREQKRQYIFVSLFVSPLEMWLPWLLQCLALGEICLFQELQEGYPCAVLAVHRISVGPHRWCILYVEKDEVQMLTVTELRLSSQHFSS